MVKLGFASFWGDDYHNINLSEIDNYILMAFRKHGVEYEIVNPFSIECDILFFSIFITNKKKSTEVPYFKNFLISSMFKMLPVTHLIYGFLRHSKSISLGKTKAIIIILHLIKNTKLPLMN